MKTVTHHKADWLDWSMPNDTFVHETSWSQHCPLCQKETCCLSCQHVKQRVEALETLVKELEASMEKDRSR